MKESRDRYRDLAFTLLLSFRSDEGQDLLRFAKSKWSKYICETLGVDHEKYLEWAEKKSEELNSPTQ